MGYGFQCFNDSGLIQVDQDYTNFCASVMGTAASNAEVANSDFGFYPHVFIKPTGSNFFCGRPYNPGRSPRTYFSFRTSGGIDYQYAVCSTTAGPLQAGNWGVQVFRADGSVAFDSRRLQPYIQAVNRYSGDDMVLGHGTGGYGLAGEAGWIEAYTYHDIVLPDSSRDWWVSIPRGPMSYEIDDFAEPFSVIQQLYVRYVADNVLRVGVVMLPDEFLPSNAQPALNPSYSAPIPLNVIVMVAKLR